MNTQVAVKESSLGPCSPDPNKKKRSRTRTGVVANNGKKRRTAAKSAANKKNPAEMPCGQELESVAMAAKLAVCPEVDAAMAAESACLKADTQIAEAVEFSPAPDEDTGPNRHERTDLQTTNSQTDTIESPASTQAPLQCSPGAPAPPASEDPALMFQKSRLLFVITTFWNLLMSRLSVAWNWAQHKLKSQQGKKRLRVCESVSLGEKRFLAVIQVDGEQFLVGGSSSSVATLAHLERPREFSGVFQQHCEQDFSRA